MLSVIAGRSIVLRALFYEYEDGPLYDPISDGIHPILNIYYENELILGPLTYSNGTGEIFRESVGNFFYILDTEEDTKTGFWLAVWEEDNGSVGEESFEVQPAQIEPQTTVIRKTSIVLKAFFYEYPGGPLYDPIGGGVYPELNIYYEDILKSGPHRYSSGSGDVLKQSIGIFFYVFSVPSDAELGLWHAEWNDGIAYFAEEFFEVASITTIGSLVRSSIVDEFTS